MLARRLVLTLAAGLLAGTATTWAGAIDPLLSEERRCLTPAPTAEDLLRAASLSSPEMAMRAAERTERIVVPTYFHVVASSRDVKGGYLSDATLKRQLDVLNKDYRPHNISFSLQGTTRRIHKDWSQYKNPQEMKRQLRQGGYEALNLYFIPNVDGYLGMCTYPAMFAPGSNGHLNDGCIVLSSSVPGGSSVNYDLGRTAVHEVGHWFNLFHTFRGGCEGEGDMIDDTPAQASSSKGCPRGRNSCPSLPGKDPIHNFMDYSNDACMEEFTRLQGVRMRSSWFNFRVRI